MNIIFLRHKSVNDQLQVPMCLASSLKPTPVIDWLLTKNEKNVLGSIRTALTDKLSGLVRKPMSRITPQFLETLLSNEKFDSNESIDLKQVNIVLKLLIYLKYIIINLMTIQFLFYFSYIKKKL